MKLPPHVMARSPISRARHADVQSGSSSAAEHPPALCGLTLADYGRNSTEERAWLSIVLDGMPHAPTRASMARTRRPRGGTAPRLRRDAPQVAARHGRGRGGASLRPRRMPAKSLFQQDIPHAVASRRMPGEPHRRIERPAGENGAVRRAVTEGHLLAGTGEEHGVLPDDIPAPHDREADLALLACVSPRAMQ